MKKGYFILVMVLCNAAVSGQISISVFGNGYIENFTTLEIIGIGSTLPAGWAFSEAGTNANSTYSAGTGSGNTADTYSFGSTGSSDRSFGGLLSGSLVTTFGAHYINNTGSTIISLSISYTGEQWRLGALARMDRLDFQYSIDATSLTSGTWIDVDALDFVSPTTGPAVGALDGNNVANHSAISSTITGLSIANGTTFWIRWNDFNATGADDGLGVDDFSIIAPTQGPLPISLNSFSGYKDGSVNQLRWTTASESNNGGFEIQRSTDGVNFTAIGFVNSQALGGNSTYPLNYSFTDNNVTGNRQYYRLRQVDFNNHSKLSNIVLIKGEKPLITAMDGLFPNPARTSVNVLIAAPDKDKVAMLVTDISGRTMIQQVVNVEPGSNTIPLDINRLTTGTYMVKLVCAGGCEGVVGKFVKQ